MTTPDLTRRAFGCAALLGIAGPLLVACGSDSAGSSSSGGSTGSGTPTAPEEDAGGAGSRSTAGGLVAAADVPVGGGVILAGQGIVVVQPTKGEFKGYSSICPHQQNPVGAVQDGAITCNFHGSQFSVEDGSVVTGPASSPLPEIPVKVTRGQVVKA
jgi:nitrite reductase/ring-hydroxylating ferredoxin subunit